MTPDASKGGAEPELELPLGAEIFDLSRPSWDTTTKPLQRPNYLMDQFAILSTLAWTVDVEGTKPPYFYPAVFYVSIQDAVTS